MSKARDRGRRASVATMDRNELVELESSLDTFGEGDDEEEENELDSEDEDEDEMLAALEHGELVEMLSETRAQLNQAAEMGQALMVELQQMELLKQDNATLQEQKEEWEAAQEEHEWRIEELEEGQQQLEQTLEDQTAELQEAEKASEELRKTIAQLRAAGSEDGGSGELDGGQAAGDATASALGATGVKLVFGAALAANRADQGSKSDAKWREQVSSLEAQLVDVRVETAELIESKRQMEEVRTASEQRARKSAEQVGKSQEELTASEKKLEKSNTMAEKGFAVATKATNRANSLELRLRMLEREFMFLREALQDPEKGEAVEKRLFSLANVFVDEAESAEGAASPKKGAPKRDTKDLTLMISKNDIVPDNHRLKLKVASLVELEAVLQAKLKVDHLISLLVWDRAFGDFVAVMSFEDVDARSKIQIVKKEEAPDAAEAIKAELDIEPEPEPEPEAGAEGSDSASESGTPKGSGRSRSPFSGLAVSSHELEREKAKVEELKIRLVAAEADAEHSRKLKSTAQAQLKAALGDDRYEEQQRRRIERSVKTMRTRLDRRTKEHQFVAWKMNVQMAKAMLEAAADATPEEREAMKAKALEEAEASQAREAELAQLKQEAELAQQTNAEVMEKLKFEEERREQKAKEEQMKAAFSQLQLPIRSVKCLGAIPIKGAGDKPFILYRMQVHVMQDKGGTPEMKRGWVVARKFALFNNLRLALKAVPTQGLKTTAPFPKDGRKFRKGGTETKAAVMERCPLLEAWLNETLSLFRNQPMVTEFLKNDGSDVNAADIATARALLTATGDAGESSNSVVIRRCKLERLLGADGHNRMGSRSPLEKTQFLLSTSREVEGMPVIKKSHILTVVTAPSRPSQRRSILMQKLLMDLQHPFVHGSHDLQYGGYQATKEEEKTPKILVLRDFAALGSVRDTLWANKAPMKGYNEKYTVDRNGAALPDETTGVGLRLVAKQVLLGMQYLETVGLPVDVIAQCGNILVLHDGTQGPPASVAISDIENAALGMRGANARHIAELQLRRPADASLYAFGLLLHELASGEQADPDAQRWPPEGFTVWSMPVQALLGKIFAPKSAEDGITTLAQALEHHALRDIKLHDSQTDGMPADEEVAALKLKYCEALGFAQAGGAESGD